MPRCTESVFMYQPQRRETHDNPNLLRNTQPTQVLCVVDSLCTEKKPTINLVRASFVNYCNLPDNRYSDFHIERKYKYISNFFFKDEVCIVLVLQCRIEVTPFNSIASIQWSIMLYEILGVLIFSLSCIISLRLISYH